MTKIGVYIADKPLNYETNANWRISAPKKLASGHNNAIKYLNRYLQGRCFIALHKVKTMALLNEQPFYLVTLESRISRKLETGCRKRTIAQPRANASSSANIFSSFFALSL